MDKQELIDKAVDEWSGVFKPMSPLVYWYGENGNYGACVDPALVDRKILFTKEEFTNRARELGWINGYKYGVEYETSGKKPDLPDDVHIEWINNERDAWVSNCTVGSLNWTGNPFCMHVKKFRIIDQRFKPVEVEQVRDEGFEFNTQMVYVDKNTGHDWYDYDKQHAIDLPPVGMECEFKHKNAQPDWARPDFCRTTPVFFGEELAVFKDKFGHETVGGHENYLFRPLDWNRKANDEKQKFVEDANSVFNVIGNENSCGHLIGLFEKLYEAGCRFTENKAAS